MALAGRNYFDSLSGERQNQYREIYNKQRSLGMPSIEAMDYAQKNIMSIEGVKAPETVPSVNPAKTMMANTTGRKSFLTGQDVQNYFGVNRQDNLATEQDKAAAKWQPSKLNGRKYFDTLTDPDQVTLYQNTYNQARNNGMPSDDAMMKAQQATEGAFAQKANEGYRNILIGDKDARDDIQQLFGVDKFNQMDIPDQDVVLNAWEAGGIDSMIEAINSNGLNKKYNINVGWNPSANAFSFAPAPGEEEPFSLETGEQITPYDTTQQKYNNKRQELEAELSRLFKEDEQNLVELYLNADGELDTAWYDSEEEINKAYQKFVNNQRRQEIEKELEALDNQYKFERQQGLVNRTENEEKREELRPQLDDITEQLGALKAQYADARLRDDQEAMSRLAEQIAELEEKEAPLEREYNDLDVTLQQANSALNATVNAFGEFGNAVVQGVEMLAANLLDTARGHMGDPASIRDDSLAKREMEQIVNAWRAMRLSEEEIADRTEKLWAMTEQAAVGNREMVDDWSKSLHDEIVNRAAIVGNYGQAVKEAVMDFAAAPWKDGQFEKYNDTKKIEAVVDFINENVVAATGIQMGQQLPSLLFNLFSGGAGAGAGLLEQTLLSPDFWMIFVGEYCGEYAEKYNNGEQITGTDEALMVFSSLINAGIELYDADGGPSGVEGYYAGVKNLAQSVGGEIWEELRQGTVTKVSEDLADLLQGRELRHPLYSADMSDSAIINIQEMIETTWRTALTTLGMDAVRASALAPIGRALGKQATNQDLTEDEKALIEQGKNIMSQLEQEAAQHQAFEQSVNGEDPETARDKPMPAREVARDIENNEGTTNEQTIPADVQQKYDGLDDDTLQTLIDNTEDNLSQAQEGTSYYQSQEQILNEARAVMENRRNGTTKTGREEPSNEGTTNEQAISSDPGQELPEQGRRPAETRPADQRKTYSEMTLEELQAEKERQEANPEGFRPDRKQALDAAIRTAEARAKITAQTPEEYRRTLREQLRDIENNEDTTNPNNIPATNRYEEPGLPDVPQAETPVPEQQEQPAQRPEGEQLQNEEALNEEQKAEQEAIAEEAEGIEENPETYIPQEGRDVPPPQGETLTDEQGMPGTNEAATAENEAAAAEQAVVTDEGQAAEATESIVQNPEEPAAPETTPVDENTEEEPQSKEGNYEEEPTDEGELPHANTKIEQETEEYAKQYGFKSGATQGDGRNDTGVHLVGTGKNISERRMQELSIIDKFAKFFGFSVEVSDGMMHNANGQYRKGGRTVYINANTNNPLQTVLGHEAFHMVKNTVPGAAAKIESLFDRYAAGANFDVNHEIDNIIALYNRKGISLGNTNEEIRAKAKEELIANSMYSLLSDEQTMRRIYAEDRNLFQRIMDWVSKVQQSIQEMLNDYADNTPEARMLRDQQGALEELHKAMLDALEEMKALDDAKKAAVPVHGNGEMTRTYERAVNRANNKAQVTEANRFLAGSVLNQTGNEVNNENIEKLYYAAQEVVGGAQPYYALKNNGLSTTGMNDDTRRAMQMLGEYFQSVLRSGSNEDYSALMNGEVQYSASDNDVTKANEVKKGMDDTERTRVLHGKQVKVEDVTGKVNEKDIISYNQMPYSKVEDKLAEDARKKGIISADNGRIKGKKFQNKHLNIEAEFSKRSLHESLNKQEGSNGNFAMLMQAFEETYKEAVPILVRDDQYLYAQYDEKKIDDFVVLLGAFTYNGKTIPVKFGLKHYGDDTSRIYIVATIKEGAILSAAPVNNADHTPPTPSSMSIDDIIRFVNPEDTKILVDIPRQFLSKEQLEGKREGLKEAGNALRQKASRKKNINAPVTMTTDRIDDAIKNYGARFSPNYSKAYMAFINPSDFIALTTTDKEKIQNESRRLIASELRDEKQTPFISYDQDTGEVTGHEGRHRMASLENAGVNRIAVLVLPDGEKGKNNRQPIAKLNLNGQSFWTGKAPGNVTLENLIPVNESHRQELIDTYGSEDDSWFQYSLPENPRRAKYDATKAEKYFGTTTNLGKSGYLTTNGKLLDMSGKHEGYDAGHRTVDHRDIQNAYEEEMADIQGTEAMIDFMRDGNIRLSPESDGIDLMTMPNEKQIQILKQFIRKAGGEVIVDISDQRGNTIESFEYDSGTPSKKVIDDLRGYFEYGIVPDEFKYSLDEEGARAGQEMWERQQEYTGGESQVLQRLTGDLWTAIAQRKQQQKAENYGQWKAHVAEMARTIKEETNSNVFTEKQLEDRLTAILEEHEKMSHATREEAENAINNTLNELQGLIQEALSDQLMDEHYKEVKSALKNGIYINPDQVKELGGAAELRDFRNALSGFCRVYTSEKAANAARAMHLDGAGWEELQSIDPDVFNPDTHWLERAQALRDFVDLHTDSTMRDDPMTRDYIRSQALATLTEYYIGSNETDATKRTRDALKKANNKVSSLERQLQNEMKAQAALADQLKAEKKASYEKLNQVQNEAFGDKTKLNQQLQEAQAQTKATSAELTQALKEQDRLRNELDAADNKAAYLENTVRLLRKQNKQNQEAAVKSDRSKRAIKARARQNIKRLEMKMRRMLEKPNNTTYVPQDMIRKLLDMVEAIQKADTRKAAQVTDKWLKAVRELRDDTNNLLKDAYDDGFIKQMEEVADIVKDRTLNQLYTDELEYVSNVMTEALHQIETARQMIGWKKNTDALKEAQNWVETMNAQKPQPTGGIGKVVNNLATEHLTPQRELDRLAGYRKDNAVYRQKEGLSEGQRVTNKVKMDQTRNFEELITGKNAQNFRKWAGKKADVIDTGIKGSRHGTFKMTHDFLTTLYMHSLNQQNMDGMKNGLMVPDFELWRQGKRKEAWDREERMYVTADDMKRLMSMVTDYDKQWAEAWKKNQAYITPKLNDVAMQLNGWHKFIVENYFPIRRDRNYLATDFDSIMLDDRIANMGFQKARKNATNPMMLESMLDVVNRTINGTSLYAGMLIPVTNFNKVFNMSLPDYEDSPKAALRRVWGNKEMEYIERMMKDLQQAGIRADESIFDKVRSKAAPAALGANPTVVIKQAASYPTAAAVLGWKPLAQQLTKPRKFDQKITDKYTSAYWERSDANIQAMNANVQSGGIDRTSSVLNKPIGAMDRATVRMIWGACEYAVEEEQPNLKRGSDEYYQAVARKYEECLEMTQPEYGTMQRPHIMRSNNTLQKAMTMYKTQSFQNMNIVYDAVQDFRTQTKAYKENQTAENKAEVDRAKTKLARAVSSQIVSAAVLAVMTAVGKALLHKPEPYQDDKGEVTAASAAYQMSKDAISSMAGMVTGGSELFDLITGIMEGKQPYDIDASAISMINDLYQSMYKLGNAATIIGDGSLSWDKKLEKGGKAVDNFLKSAGAMLGIPYNNMRNIGTSVYKYADDILSGRGMEGLTTGDVTLNTAARYMGEALQRGDTDAYVRLYNRLLKQGKTASQINSAMKSWMKTSDPRIQQAATAIDSGDIDTYNMLINQMTDAGYGMANVVTAIEAVRKAAAESSEEGGVRSAELENAPMTYDQIIEAQENADASAYTYAQMNQLLDSGNTRAALQVQKALFKSKGTTAVKSALTSYWKPKYQEAYQNRNRAELNRITRLLKTMGYSDQSINKWKSVESTTTNTSSKKTGFGSGTFGSSFGKKSSSKKSSSRFGRRF